MTTQYYPAIEIRAKAYATERGALRAAGVPARQARRAIQHARQTGAAVVGVESGQHWLAALPAGPSGESWSPWTVLRCPCNTAEEARRIAESVVAERGGGRGAVLSDFGEAFDATL